MTAIRHRIPRRLPLVVGFVLLCPALLWWVGHWAWISGLEQLRAQTTSTLGVYTAGLRRELEKYEALPRVVAMDSRVEQLLRADPANASELTDSLNRHLERVSESAGASDVYLMDATGLTLAASNWDSDSPFIGSNFAFRPYFKDAAAGRPGHYFALGTASNKRGYYYSAPVPGADGIAGVVAVKVSLGDLEASWSRSSEHLLVTDPDGVIFIASDPRWRFRSLERLDYSVLERIRDSRRYPEVAIEPLPVTARWGAAGGTRLLRLKSAASEAPRNGFVDVMIQSRPMADVGWTVHLLSEIAPLRHRVVVAVLTAGLAAVVLLLISLFALQRRDHARERVAMQRRAHEQLEGLVTERTRALVQSNEQLAHEIAERKETEHALRSTQDELVQAGKLAALGQMAAEIAHELNQPLAAIRGYADNARTLLERARTAEAVSNLSLIGELTTRMATITGQLKTFARKSSGEPAEVAVATVLDEALGLLGPRLHRAGITLTRQSPPPEVRVLGDAVRLEQVVVNLVHNAMDAMHDAPVKHLDVAVEATNEDVRIRVQDSGNGIDERALPKLFEPYFTTKEIGSGLGLGLSISYGIVKDHGGSVAAANRAGGGAEFLVTLPRAGSVREKVA